MKISLAARFAIFGLTVGWLVVGLAWSGLLIQLGQSDGLVRYPGAVRLTEPEFRWDFLSKGYFRQSGVYHTSDAWPQVLNWYARYLSLDLDRRPQLTGNCFHVGDTDAPMIIRQSVGVTLCARAAGTTIFVYRTLTLPR